VGQHDLLTTSQPTVADRMRDIECMVCCKQWTLAKCWNSNYTRQTAYFSAYHINYENYTI